MKFSSIVKLGKEDCMLRQRWESTNDTEMDEAKKESLESAGWQAVTIKELFDLSNYEAFDIELKIHLSDANNK